MTITANTNFDARWFIPEDQENEENPAKFRIKPLKGSQIDLIRDQDLLKILVNCLVSWDGILDDDGKEIRYKASKLDVIPMRYLDEVANEIVRITNVTGEQEKN